MTPQAIDGAARMLTESRRSQQLLDALPEAFRPATLDEAQERWRDFDLETLDVELVVDYHRIVHRTGGHPTKDPLLPAVALVNDLRGSTGVRVGQIVTTGTYTGLNFAKPGQTVVATFAG